MNSKENPFLSGLPAEVRAQIHPVRRRYHAGMAVHEAGEVCGVLDVVCSGRLAAHSPHEDGANTALFEFEKGAVLGSCLMFGESPYPLRISCETDCTLLQISRRDVELLLRADEAFMMRFIHTLSHTAMWMNHKLQMLTQKNLRQNIEDYLCALAQQQGTREVVLPMSKKQLAGYFGVQRPSLFRELKRMKDEGRIEVRSRAVTLHF